MYKKKLNRFFVFFHLLFITTVYFSACQKSETDVLIGDKFESKNAQWKEVYLTGSSGGSYSISNGKLNIEIKDENTMYGLYRTSPVSGHFIIDASFVEDEHVGLALLQEKDGKPDIENFTMLCVDKNEENLVMVRVRDRQKGETDVLDNTGKFDINRFIDKPMLRSADWSADNYIHLLTGRQYSVPFTETNKKLRIYRDNPAGFFHYYYEVKKKIHGEEAAGWMEIVPSSDWAQEGQKYYVALVGISKGNAVFDEVLALQKPEVDQDDRATGFKAVKREYNWSGFSGDAVVVSFDNDFKYHDRDVKFVFWSESNYQPAWHLDNQKQVTYEFLETWIRPHPECYEPMSDRIHRWTRADILEDNEVRKVVHWHYVLCNPDYKVPFDDQGEQLPEADEYFTFYPDGNGIRHIVYTPKLDIEFRSTHEIGELQVNAGSLSHPYEFFDSPALTLLNLEGEVEYTHPGPKFSYDSKLDTWKQMIMAVHLRNEPDVFCSWSTDSRTPDTYSGYKIRYINAWHSLDGLFIHWPVGKRPYTFKEGGTGTWKAEASHASLMSWGIREGIDWEDNYQLDERGRKYRQWISLIGLNDRNDLQALKDKTSSWLFPGTINMTEASSRFIKTDHAQKAIVFEKVGDAQKCYFQIDPTEQNSVLINPVLRINNWGTVTPLNISINDEALSKDLYKFHLLNDRDALIWINKTINTKTKINIEA